MAYTDTGPSNRQRMMMIGMIAGSVMLVLLITLTPWNKIIGGLLWSPARIEQAMLANPQTAPMIRELKADYPATFADMVGRYSVIMRGGGNQQEAEADLAATMRTFVRSKATAIAAAPDSALVALAKARAKMLSGIQAVSVHDCATIASGQKEAGERYIDLIAPVSRLTIAAAHQGELTPVRRNVAAPSARDIVLLRNSATALGMTEKHWALIGSPYAMQNAPESEQCAANVFLMKAVAALPPASSANLTAVTVRASLD